MLDPEEGAKLLGSTHHLPPESVRIYCRLWELETWLREMAYVELKSTYGLSWSDRLKSFEHHKDKDKLLIHMTTPEDSPLAYHTLSGLWAAMTSEEHWPLFRGYFPPKALTEAKFQELFQIRHRVAHFRRPHSDDLARVSQFLRDVDQPFWRFVTSYNESHPITPASDDPVAARFIEHDQYPWLEVEPHTWARLGRKERGAVLTLRIDYSIRPWVDVSKLGKPPVPNRGVLYHVAIQALDARTFDYQPLLERTQRLHARCVHVIIDGSTVHFTIPSFLPNESISETIDSFWEASRRYVSVVTSGPSGDSDKAERIADGWPEYVLGPRNPLAFLCPDMPCTFFGA